MRIFQKSGYRLLKFYKLTLISTITLFIFAFQASSFAQRMDSTLVLKYTNNINIELGGNGIAYSVSYDHTLENGIGYKINGRIGVSLLTDYTAFFIEPLAIFGTSPNYFELGLGYTTASLNNSGLFSGDYTFITTRFGYRFESKTQNLIFRIAILPSFTSRGYVIPWAGLSFGFCFPSKK